MKTKVVKLWVHWNGNVRLTLRDGEEVHLTRSGPTDEGYYSEERSYFYDAKAKLVECITDLSGSDCDGPWSKRFVEECLVFGESLPANPEWRTTRRDSHDFFAEQMGY